MRSSALVAALLVATVSGCGNDNGKKKVDAGLGSDADGGIDPDGDTPPVDVMVPVDADPSVRGTVTVTIVDKNDAPLPGMHVVFIDTDATVTDVVTNSAGVAQGSVYPGASVTALRERTGGGGYSLTTVLELVPSDAITLISADSDAESGEDPFSVRAVPLPSADLVSAVKSGSTTVFTTLAPHGLAVGDRVVVRDVLPIVYNGEWTVTSAPTTTSFVVAVADNTAGTGGTAAKLLPFTVSFPAYGGATFYEVHTPCGPVNVGTQTTAQVMLRAGCATPTMDIVVYAKSNATTELAYAVKSAVAFTAGGSTTITDTWHTPTPITSTYTNPTTRVTDIGLARHTPYPRGAASASGTASADPASTTTFILDSALLPSAWMRTTLRCPDGSGVDCISSQVGTAVQTVSKQVDGTATSLALDVGANLLPWVSATWVKQTTTLDLTVTGTQPIDLFETNLRYVRGQAIYTWRVFGPIPVDVTFPTLPSTLPGDPTIMTCNTDQCVDAPSSFQVFLCESDAIGGYRDAIKNPYRSLATCDTSTAVTSRPFPVGTTNRISQWN